MIVTCASKSNKYMSSLHMDSVNKADSMLYLLEEV